MFSALSLLFFFPAALLMWVPVLAIINGAYNGDQAMVGVVGMVFALPGMLFVVIDLFRRGWRASIIGLVGIGLLSTPFVAIVALGGACELTSSCASWAEPPALRKIRAVKGSELTWGDGVETKGVLSAWAIGGPQGDGLNVTRSRLSKGGRVQPHAHSRERVMSIISGSLFAASGDRFDENTLVRYEAGNLLHVPPNTMHYFSAPEGDVVFDEYGSGKSRSYEAWFEE